MIRSEAIILGSGTSNGVPMLGDEYPPGYLANPKNRRNRSCVVLQGPAGNLLIDCPPELRLMCTAENITRFEAVLITHTHADHVMGMDDLRSICILTNSPVIVYTLPQYQNDIRRIFPYAFQQFPPGVWVPRFDMRDVPEEIEVGGLTVKTFTVRHGILPVTGIRVNDFAYVTDVSHIPAKAMAMLKDLETFVVDAVRIKPHPNHFHFDRAIEVAKEVGARKTYFTHLAFDYDHDVTNAALPAGIELAYDGLRVPL
ncbi:MAG TPA: MBL fold metallo-hydrolase [Fimbriimonas sp.]|nr:MBL fold metallo-hydrolase [Fimbriimonas sp.]